MVHITLRIFGIVGAAFQPRSIVPCERATYSPEPRFPADPVPFSTPRRSL
jgi:hypothetical protein